MFAYPEQCSRTPSDLSSSLRLDGHIRASSPPPAALAGELTHPSLAAPFDRAVGHERRYRRGALARSLRDAGFDIDELRFVNPIGALGWFARMRLLRQRDWPSTTFHVFDRLVPLLRPLDALRLPFGLSLWAVARRTSGLT